jgi:hypothetical protein
LVAVDPQRRRPLVFDARHAARVDRAVLDAFDDQPQAAQPVRAVAAQVGLDQHVGRALGVGLSDAELEQRLDDQAALLLGGK